MLAACQAASNHIGSRALAAAAHTYLVAADSMSQPAWLYFFIISIHSYRKPLPTVQSICSVPDRYQPYSIPAKIEFVPSNTRAEQMLRAPTSSAVCLDFMIRLPAIWDQYLSIPRFCSAFDESRCQSIEKRPGPIWFVAYKNRRRRASVDIE